MKIVIKTFLDGYFVEIYHILGFPIVACPIAAESIKFKKQWIIVKKTKYFPFDLVYRE